MVDENENTLTTLRAIFFGRQRDYQYLFLGHVSFVRGDGLVASEKDLNLVQPPTICGIP
jgi:adenine specific DNA methylase Mod